MTDTNLNINDISNMSEEEFKKQLLQWVERNDVSSSLQSKLRKDLFESFNSTSLGKLNCRYKCRKISIHLGVSTRTPYRCATSTCTSDSTIAHSFGTKHSRSWISLLSRLPFHAVRIFHWSTIQEHIARLRGTTKISIQHHRIGSDLRSTQY